MSIAQIIALIRFAVWAAQVIKEAYDSLTPAEKEQIAKAYADWQEAIKAVQDPMAGPTDGSGP